MLRFAGLALLLAPTLVAQPVLPQAEGAAHLLSEWGEPVTPLASVGSEAPRGLYWMGVAVDVAMVGGAAYLAVQGLPLVGAEFADQVEPGNALVILSRAGGVLLALVIGLPAAYDLVRVVGGHDPWLTQRLDPNRRPGGDPPAPPPGLPPTR